MAEKKFYFEMNKANKKGDINFSVVNWIMAIIFTICVGVFVYYMVEGHLIKEVNVQDAEMEIFIQRLLYSRNGISYYDTQLNRLYPGIIAIENFNQDYADKNLEPAIFYGTENRLIGAKMELLEKDGRKIENLVVKYNAEFYDEKEVLYRAGKGTTIGKGAVTGKELKVPVLITEKGTTRVGYLTMTIVMQNL